MNETKTSCAPADNRSLTWDGMNSVSYTHLDVYKRQLPDGKLYIASEFLRKPHQLKFFGLFSGVAHIFFKRHLGGIDC